MRIALDVAHSFTLISGERSNAQAFNNLVSQLRAAQQHEIYLIYPGDLVDSNFIFDKADGLISRKHLVPIRYDHNMTRKYLIRDNKLRTYLNGMLRRSTLEGIAPHVIDYGSVRDENAIGANYIPPRQLDRLHVMHVDQKITNSALLKSLSPITELALKRSNLIITDTLWSSTRLKAELNDYQQTFRVVYHGIEELPSVSQFVRRSETTREISYLSDYDDASKLRQFYRAVILLDPDIKWNSNITVHCEDELGREIAKQVALDFGFEGITTTIVRTDPTAANILNSSDLVLYRSTEGENDLRRNELVAASTPFLISRGGSTSELANSDSLIFDPLNREDLAAKMTKALIDREFRQKVLDERNTLLQTISKQNFGETFLSIVEEELRKIAATATARIDKQGRNKQLYYFSPLPPLQTGIADYSAELVRSLSVYYDIVCVVDQDKVEDEWIQENCVILNHREFGDDLATGSVTIYNLGNSEYHAYMLRYINEKPGVTILHDLFLGHLMGWLRGKNNIDDSTLKNEIYLSHGIQAIVDGQNTNFDQFILKWPISGFVFRKSTSVILHSKYAETLAIDLYGPIVRRKLTLVPQIRERWHSDETVKNNKNRFPVNSFIVATFGMVTGHKHPEELLEAWIKSSLSKNENSYLLYVGDISDQMRGLLNRRLQSNEISGRVIMTGHVESSEYQAYLHFATIVVQLRRDSRGETSRAMLDVLAAGKPLISNAHGSASEYARSVVNIISDPLQIHELTASLEHLATDEQYRLQLSREGQKFVEHDHNPARVANQVYKVLEQSTGSSIFNEQTMISQISSYLAAQRDYLAEIQPISELLNCDYQLDRMPQLLVDVTVLAESDMHTGIQRVTKAVLKCLLNEPPRSFRVEPVIIKDGRPVYARQFVNTYFGQTFEVGTELESVCFGPQDHYLGLDWVPDRYPSALNWFSVFRSLGGTVSTVIYDILPILSPAYFPPNSEKYFRLWLESAIKCSDNLICISRAVSNELRSLVSDKYPDQKSVISNFQLGSDLVDLQTVNRQSDETESVDLKPGITFLMVGSLEPRKGYVQVIEAFSILWRSKLRLNLVIVGRKGWKYDDIEAAVSASGQLGSRLIVLSNASDELLSTMYNSADALIAASYGEGFGLPLVESLRRGLPVIARDIPVFREVCPNAEVFFETLSSEELAELIRLWAQTGHSRATASIQSQNQIDWRRSTMLLLEKMLVN